LDPSGDHPPWRLLIGGADPDLVPPTESTAAPPPTPPLAPVLAVDALLDAETERRLTALAHLARAGDTGARDALFVALGPKLDRMLARCRGLAWSSAGPRRDGCPWELEDLGQQAYLVYVDLLGHWSGVGPVGPYLLAHLPWRIRNAWRELTAARRRAAPLSIDETGSLDDGTAAAAEGVARLEAIAAALPPPDGVILLLRIRDQATAAEIAASLRINRRTFDRHWRRLRERLRRELAAPEAEVGKADRPRVPPQPAMAARPLTTP